jgi:putative redox protein
VSAEAPTPAPKPPNRVHVEWAGGQRFDAGRPGGPTLRIDGTGETGQGPVDAVLTALASCISIDVVEILAKRRTPVGRLAVEVTGGRVTTIPRRLRHIRLDFHVDGEGIERVHAERAIDLAITKYCSVRDSLAPDIALEWALTLNGEAPAGEAESAGREPAEPAGRA